MSLANSRFGDMGLSIRIMTTVHLRCTLSGMSRSLYSTQMLALAYPTLRARASRSRNPVGPARSFGYVP